MATVPYEVVVAEPFTLFWAAIGTAFPSLNVADPTSVGWTRVGTSGNLNYEESGIKVSSPQTIQKWRSMGDAAPRKHWRTEEDFMMGLELADFSLEQLRHGLNMNPVSVVAPGSGTVGYKKIGLSRGKHVAQVSLLCRGVSAYGDGMLAQYEIPYAFQTGSPEPVLGSKEKPIIVALEWSAVIDPNATSEDERFGRLLMQHAAAL